MNFQAMEVIGALQRTAVLVRIQQYAYQMLAQEKCLKYGVLMRYFTILLLQTLLKIVKDLLPLIGIAVRMPFRVCLEVEIVTTIHNVLEILFAGLIIATGTFRHLTVIG